MFRPCKWAIIRLLVEPMGRLYTKGLGRGEISSYIILWGSRLLILHMLSGYHVEIFGIYLYLDLAFTLTKTSYFNTLNYPSVFYIGYIEVH
jgi:hypothetical protein